MQQLRTSAIDDSGQVQGSVHNLESVDDAVIVVVEAQNAGDGIVAPLGEAGKRNNDIEQFGNGISGCGITEIADLPHSDVDHRRKIKDDVVQRDAFELSLHLQCEEWRLGKRRRIDLEREPGRGTADDGIAVFVEIQRRKASDRDRRAAVGMQSYGAQQIDAQVGRKLAPARYGDKARHLGVHVGNRLWHAVGTEPADGELAVQYGIRVWNGQAGDSQCDGPEMDGVGQAAAQPLGTQLQRERLGRRDLHAVDLHGWRKTEIGKERREVEAARDRSLESVQVAKIGDDQVDVFDL